MLRVRWLRVVVVVCLAALFAGGIGYGSWRLLDYQPRATVGPTFTENDAGFPLEDFLSRSIYRPFQPAFSADGRILMVPHAKEIRFFDSHTSRDLGGFTLPHFSARDNALMLPNGRFLVTYRELREIPSGQLRLRASIEWDHFSHPQISPNCTVLSWFDRQEVKLLAADTLEEILRIVELHFSWEFASHGVMYASDSNRAAIWVLGTVYVWERGTKNLKEFKTTSCAALSPDGKTLACVDDRRIVFWDIDTRTDLGHLSGYRGQISTLLYSPDGTQIVTTTKRRLIEDEWNMKPALQLWGVATRKVIASREFEETSIDWCEFLARGKVLRVITAPFAHAFIVTSHSFDEVTGKNTPCLPGKDDPHLMTILEPRNSDSGCTLSIRDLTNQNSSDIIHSPTRIIGPNSVKRTSDGRYVLVDNNNLLLSGIHVFETETGTQTATIRGERFEFTPDERTLATWTRSGPVLLWDFPLRKPMKTVWAFAVIPALLVLLIGLPSCIYKVSRPSHEQANPSTPDEGRPPSSNSVTT